MAPIRPTFLNKTSNQNRLLLGLYLFLLIGYTTVGFIGHFGFDDIVYAEYAVKVMRGTFELDGHHFSYRWGAFMPLALAFKLFGYSDVSAVIPNFLACLSVAAILLHVLKQVDFIWRVAALSFFALNNWLLSYASTLMGDIWVMFWKILVIFGLYLFYFKKWKDWKAALVIAIAFICGFMTKGNIIYILPVLFYFFINDLFFRKLNYRFWLLLSTFSLGCFGLYFGYFYWAYDNAFIRFQRIAENPYFSECSYESLPRIHTWKRIGYEFIWMSIKNYWFLPFVLFCPLLLKKSSYSLKNQTNFFVIIALVYWLSSNFMSTSYHYYAPLCLDIRHYLVMVPLAALAAAQGLSSIWTSKASKNSLFQALLILIAFILILIFDGNLLRQCYYGMASLLFFGHFFLHKRAKLKKYWIAGIVIIQFLPLYYQVQFANGDNYFNQKIVLNQIDQYKAKAGKTLVITDDIQAHIARYVMAFDSSSIVFRSFEKIKGDTLDSSFNKHLMITNGLTSYYSKVDWAIAPNYVVHKDSLATFLFEEKGIKLWELSPEK